MSTGTATGRTAIGRTGTGTETGDTATGRSGTSRTARTVWFVSAAAVTLTFAATLSGCGNASPSDQAGSPGFTVSDPAVGAVPGDAAAVYLSIRNQGPDDALIGAGCDCAKETSLHSTEDHDGVALMVPTDRVGLPSGETTVLEPGGPHLMLDGLAEPLEAGDSIEIILEFDHGGTRAVEVPVVPLDELAERAHR